MEGVRCLWLVENDLGELLRECCQILCGMWFPLRLEATVYKKYVRPAISCGSEFWCLLGDDMGVLGHGDSS